MSERLVKLHRRIEILSTRPQDVKAPWTRLIKPILKRLGVRPVLKVERAQELRRTLARSYEAGVSFDAEIDLAIDELEKNVASVERACVVNGRTSTAHAAFLERLHEAILRSMRAAEASTRAARRLAAGIDEVMLLPPLEVQADEQDDAEDEKEPSPQAKQQILDNQRLLSLQLGAIDHLIDAAREETSFLGRRRRLLEAARQVLLESAAALPLDATGVEQRRAHIAREIVRIDRLEAAGVDPGIAILHQARGALSRGDRDRLHATLVALDGAAMRSGDGEIAARTGDAIARMWGERDPETTESRMASLARTQDQSLGRPILDAIARAKKKTLAEAPAIIEKLDPGLQAMAREYLGSDAEPALLSAMVAVDGSFEVGGALSPVRVAEHETRVRSVSWPTQDMVLMPATHVTDVPNAVIDDPRLIVLNLAAGRLLTRRFVQYETITKKRTKMVGEVRVYVVDGSGSMLGPRAHVRDAILLQELTAVMKRAEVGSRTTRVVLYYRYFNTELLPITRVDGASTALAAIGDVLGTPRVGGTNIEKALLSSMDQVAEARKDDPDLARAQIVLITDGESYVRQEKVDAARARLAGFPVAVSVIALGEHNDTLRKLVAEQRAAGERAFYHYLNDEALRAMVGGDVDGGGAIHVPALVRDATRTPREIADALSAELGELLDELSDIDRKRDVEAIEAMNAERKAMADMGLDERTSLTDGERAHREAVERDQRALDRRYARWFPAPSKETPNGPRDADIEAAIVALGTVAEVIGVVGGTELARRADAIDLIERLLPDAGLSPERYRHTLERGASHLGTALAAVHASTKTTLPTK